MCSTSVLRHILYICFQREGHLYRPSCCDLMHIARHQCHILLTAWCVTMELIHPTHIKSDEQTSTDLFSAKNTQCEVTFVEH